MYKDVNLNLEILAEECAEVIRIKSKIFRFGLLDHHPKNGENNKASLETELGHVVAMIVVLIGQGVISETRILEAIGSKLDNLKKWYQPDNFMNGAQNERENTSSNR